MHDPIFRLNVGRLVMDLGGPAVVARSIGVPRTVPYRWLQRNYLSSRVIERLKTAHPELNIDHYFEDA
ncbi:MAG: hypothetical protein ACK52I_06315, partial [Pseudomonadota bacterium]